MAKNGLDKWFKQKWVDIGSKRKDGSFAKVWPFKTEEGREEEVSKMRASSESETNVGGSEKICRCQKRAAANVGPKPTNVKTFARKKAATGGMQKYIGRSIRGEYGGVNLSNPSYVKYYKGMLD